MEGWTEWTDWEEKSSFYQELAMPFLGESPQRPVGTWRMRKGKPTKIAPPVHGGDGNLILYFLA